MLNDAIKADHVIAGNPTTAPALLANLISHPNWQVVQAALANRSLPLGVLERVCAMSLSGPEQLALDAATIGVGMANLVGAVTDTGEALARVRGWSEDELVALLIRNECCPTGFLDDVLAMGVRREKTDRNGFLDCLRDVVAHPNASTAVVRWAVKSEWYYFRAVAATRETIGAADLRALARDPDVNVRIAAAGNPALPDALFSELLASFEEGSLATLLDQLDGARRAACAELLFPIASMVWTRRNVAEVTGNPSHVEVLCWDEDASVRAAAAANPLASETDRISVALRAM